MTKEFTGILVRRRSSIWLLVVIFITPIFLPALPGAPGAPSDNGETLLVFAAASLTDAFTEIGAAFESRYPGMNVLFNFAGSSTLAAQLVNGAPADVFASANHIQMEIVQQAGRVETAATQIFAHNQVVTILPLSNPAKIQTLRDLAKPGVLLVLAAPLVPVRTYSDQALQLMAEDAAYGPDFAAQVMANLVSEEVDVRQVVAKIVLGEADAGIVYRSDVTADVIDHVQMLDIPAEVNVRADYPLAPLNDSPHIALADEFIEFVLSQPGQAILMKWGFIPAASISVSNTNP